MLSICVPVDHLYVLRCKCWRHLLNTCSRRAMMAVHWWYHIPVLSMGLFRVRSFTQQKGLRETKKKKWTLERVIIGPQHTGRTWRIQLKVNSREKIAKTMLWRDFKEENVTPNTAHQRNKVPCPFFETLGPIQSLVSCHLTGTTCFTCLWWSLTELQGMLGESTHCSRVAQW